MKLNRTISSAEIVAVSSDTMISHGMTGRE
jgi:hypothetical protein